MRSHLFRYRYDGREWGFEIEAASLEEARERLARMAYASYDGELVARVPLSLSAPARIGVAIRNAMSRLLGMTPR